MSNWKTGEPPLGTELEVEVNEPGDIRQGKLQMGVEQLVSGSGPNVSGLRNQRPVGAGYILTDETGKQLTGIVKLIRWREIGGEGT